MPTAVVIGGGGREHALVEALLASPARPSVRAVPGNAGMPPSVERREVSLGDLSGLEASCADADLVVIGPEGPLVAGLAERIRDRGCPVLGPGRAAAHLEGSKSFAKTVMDRVGVPTARWGRFSRASDAKAFARTLGEGRAVVKADGLAAGKGVVVAEDFDAADRAIERSLEGGVGSSEAVVVVEERLVGEELSLLALCDGSRMAWFAPAQDHKRLGEGDIGPNTGGMGAYAPVPGQDAGLLADIRERCMQPVIDYLAARGTPLVGVLYAGLMLTEEGPRVLEYNVRFGDPEAQVILPLVSEDTYELFRATALGGLSARPVELHHGAALAVVMASAGYPGSARSGDLIRGLDEAMAVPGLHVFHAATKRGPSGEWQTAGGRVLAFTGVGSDLESAQDTAYAGVRCVNFEGAQFRKDIGARYLKAPRP